MSDEGHADEWTIERVRAEAASIVDGANDLRPEERLGYIKGRLQGLPKQVCDALEPLVLETERIVRRDARTSSGKLQTWEKVMLFAFGGLFLILLVVLAVFIPEPKPFQKNVFCTALSVSAACIGAVVPGLIHVQGRIENFAVRATGAIAFGVLVAYLCRR